MTIPARSAFMAWPDERIARLAAGRTMVFAPGGTSRWYFLEHGSTAEGYSKEAAFTDYGRRSLRRTVELVAMMARTGMQMVFVVGFVPGQDQRTQTYNANLRWGYELLVDDGARALYRQHDLGVLFRGGWDALFERLGAEHLSTAVRDLEAATAAQSKPWLVWLTQSAAPVPQALTGLVAEHIRAHGRMPPREDLCAAYYNRPISHVDILLGHNKPSLAGLIPPMMTVGDAYFSVRPSYYLTRDTWRHILYDYLFSRRTSHRDYDAISAGDLESLRAFYDDSPHTLGIGRLHEPTQTWRPVLPD